MPGETLRSTVGTLRIHSQRADTPQLRLSVGSRLRGVSLEPSSLPPSAILVIRRISDPLPGQLGTEGISAGHRWERALRESIDGKFRSAARPRRGVIESNSDAILFHDQAELVACLCADLATGRAFQRWWWRQLLATSALVQPASAMMSAQLVRMPESIPAVLQLLRDWGRVADVLSTLERGDALAVTSAMLIAYDHAHLAERLQHSGASRSDLPVSAPEQSATGIVSEADKSAKDADRPVAPLAELPEVLRSAAAFVPDSLPAEQSTLGVLADLLLRSPLLLRRPEIQEAIVDRHVLQRHYTEKLARHDEESERSPSSIMSPVHERDHQEAVEQVKDREPEAAADVDPSDATVAVSDDAGESQLAKHDPAVATTGADRPESDSSTSMVEFGNGVYTRLGGILYLLNVFEHFGWPHYVFTRAFVSAPPGPWCTIDAVARLLIGPEFAECQADEIWPFLAELDNRDPADTLGASLVLADEFQLPGSWARALQADTGRGPADELAENRFVRRHCKDLNFSRDLGRWLAVAFPAIEQMLAGAIPVQEGRHVVPEWMICPGTLYSTKTHIDLVSSLEHISMPARQAGLDRDPGWCPSLGRVVQFHFDGAGNQ